MPKAFSIEHWMNPNEPRISVLCCSSNSSPRTTEPSNLIWWSDKKLLVIQYKILCSIAWHSIMYMNSAVAAASSIKEDIENQYHFLYCYNIVPMFLFNVWISLMFTAPERARCLCSIARIVMRTQRCRCGCCCRRRRSPVHRIYSVWSKTMNQATNGGTKLKWNSRQEK